MWNVKGDTDYVEFKFPFGINRNIVECKVHNSRLGGSRRKCINRNIVECKDGMNLVLVDGDKVLIETLWNVKKINSIYYFEPGGY